MSWVYPTEWVRPTLARQKTAGMALRTDQSILSLWSSGVSQHLFLTVPLHMIHLFDVPLKLTSDNIIAKLCSSSQPFY